MTSINPPDTEWFLLHINLSQEKQVKSVGDETIEFQRYLPPGILWYGPDLEIETNFHPFQNVELATIHFHQSLIEEYFDSIASVVDHSKNLIYEDLDNELEGKLEKALRSISNKIKCHACVLDFLDSFFEKLKIHELADPKTHIHSEDVKNLFQAAATLRDPLIDHIPTVSELSEIAHMSPTKFKTKFKQLFGTAPHKYHKRIKMEYARTELQDKKRSPAEISYELGFSHPSNFTSAYKKHFNQLPSEA